ncbi:serine hydrolase domain-containing protein [Aureispira anguillae]|uniref:Beta-lactamase family protein n=1 Tax=Aureispira anguillae TaxID=2864201 RepID=A0A915YBF2_9BACT|nr:serine hydrolase domain-containing protein [Aureispira anguillae]BDS09989.1 beta-lactamase family protein [Aureispira anguillae]
MKYLLVFLFPLFFFKISTAQSPLEFVKKYGSNFPTYTELSIAVINGEQITFYGFIKKETGFEPKENKNSIFEIGSITKVFTSTLLADQVVKGKIKLEQTIKKSLPFKLKGRPKITFKTLANHTAGLPRLPDNLFAMMANNPDNPYKGYNAQKLKEYCAKELTLSSAIGEQYAYSNLGAGLLGYALCQKTKQSYEDLLQTIVFEPLQMNHSTTLRDSVKGTFIKGLDPTGSVTSNWDLEVLAPAGNILSSVRDLSKFVRANFEIKNKVFALQQTKTHTIGEKMDIALGWHIIHAKSGANYHWHNGGTGGYTSSMIMDVPNQKGIVILSNVSAFHSQTGNIDRLAFEWMKKIADVSPKEKTSR